MTQSQFTAWVEQEEELTRLAVAKIERRRAEFAELRAKIDRIQLDRWLGYKATERLTAEEISFLLLRNPGRPITEVAS